jgi:hypothetical protein
MINFGGNTKSIWQDSCHIIPLGLKAYGVLACRPVKLFCLLLQAPYRPLKFARTREDTNDQLHRYALQMTTLDLPARKFLRNGVLCEDTGSPNSAQDKSRVPTSQKPVWPASTILARFRLHN